MKATRTLFALTIAGAAAITTTLGNAGELPVLGPVAHEMGPLKALHPDYMHSQVVIVGRPGRGRGAYCNISGGNLLVTIKNIGSRDSGVLPVLAKVNNTELLGTSPPIRAGGGMVTVALPMGGAITGGDWSVSIKIPTAEVSSRCLG